MFVVGDIIRFRYTGMRAEILEDHLDGSYSILDDDGEETIAFVEDIVLAQNFEQIELSEVQKNVQKKKKPKKEKHLTTEEMFYTKAELEQKFQSTTAPRIDQTEKSSAPSFNLPIISPTPPSDSGCFLALVPIAPQHYSIYLINDTRASFGFEFRLFLNQEIVHGFDKVIPANDFFAIGEFSQAQFNDTPLLQITFPRLQFEKKIKLKFKKFARAYQTVPLMGIESYAYSIFEKFPPKSNVAGSLKGYTAAYQKDRASILRPLNNYYKRLNLMEHASFNIELDLHAEKLVNDTSEFTQAELFEIQLDVLDKYIHKAAALDRSLHYTWYWFWATQKRSSKPSPIQSNRQIV
jgi:hypothetical protein